MCHRDAPFSHRGAPLASPSCGAGAGIAWGAAPLPVGSSLSRSAHRWGKSFWADLPTTTEKSRLNREAKGFFPSLVSLPIEGERFGDFTLSDEFQDTLSKAKRDLPGGRTKPLRTSVVGVVPRPR